MCYSRSHILSDQPRKSRREFTSAGYAVQIEIMNNLEALPGYRMRGRLPWLLLVVGLALATVGFGLAAA